MKRKTRNFRKIVTLTVFMLLLAALPISMVFAASSGPNDAGTGADVSGVGTITWTNPGNITAAGTPYATAAVSSSSTTHYLQGTNYGFAIPTDATINGITVVIRRQSSGVISPFVQDNVVSLVKGGAIVGDNKAALGTNWPTAGLGTRTYGSSSDLWGTTWTPAEINANDFGVALSATNAAWFAARDATVDYLRITVEFTLPTPTLSVTNSPVTYNGAPQAAAVSGSVAGTVSDVQYNGSSTVPTDAGTYAVTADFTPDNPDYVSLADAAAGDFVIEQATPTVSVTNSPVTYTGSPQAAAVSGSVAGTVSNVQYDGSSTAPTDAGTYAVTADFTPDDAVNYESLTGASAGDFVIEQATPTVSVTNSPVTYTGTPQAAAVSGSVAGTVSNVQYDGSSTVPTDAGTYAVTADFTPDDAVNYESLTGASAGDFVIEQATPTVSVTNSPVTYNGTPQAAAVSGSVAGTVSNVQYDGSSTVPTDAGTYAVTADFTPDDAVNYESLTGASAGDFVIEQATPTVSVTNSPVTYNGTPQAAAVSGSVAGTVSSVQYDGSSTAPTDAGTYAVTADFVPDDTANYESLTGAAAGDFVIEQATPTVSVTNSPVTYNGTPQAAAVSGSVAGTVSNVQYDGSSTVPTDAGTYAVTADFTPDDTTNYESLTGAAAGDFVIDPATPTLSVTNSPVIYTGLPQAAVVVGSVPGTVSNVQYDGSSTEPTDEGTYAVTADFVPDDTANYESLTGASAGDFVIHGATPTLSVTNSPVTYTGSPQAAVVTGSVPGTVSNVLYDGSSTAQTDAGTYAVTADFVPDNPSFESLTGAPAGDFVIDPATPTLSVTNSPVTFTGLPQEAEVMGSVPGTVSNVLYNGSATIPSLPGIYAVTADFTPDDTVNYETLGGAPAGDFVILGFLDPFPGDSTEWNRTLTLV